MINPDQLLDTLLATLTDIPDLVALMSNITAYHLTYPARTNHWLAIREMASNSAIVAHTETRIDRRSKGIEHYFSVYFRPMVQPGSIFVALREGIVTSLGTKFKRSQIVNDCYMPEVQGLFARNVLLTELASIDYHEIPIMLGERGADL